MFASIQFEDITIIMFHWVIHSICPNMHGVHSAWSRHPKSAVINPPQSQKPFRCQNTFSQRGVFSRMRSIWQLSHRGEKKKFTHKATPAPCAAHYRRSCCIFLWGYMLSFDTQRSHGVRDAPSHGNSFRRVRETRDRALTVKSIKQRVGFQPNGLHWVTTTIQWFAPRIFSPFLARRKICSPFSFCTERIWQRKLICMIGEQEHTVWSGKPDIYGWEIYPKMYERRKSLSTSSGE